MKLIMPNDGVDWLVCPLRYGTRVKNEVLRGALECAIVASASLWKASNPRIAEAVGGSESPRSLLARNARLAGQRNDSAASEAAMPEAILVHARSRI